MDVSKLVLVAAAAFGPAIPAAQAQDEEELAVESAQQRGPPKPWKNVRGFGRVLDLTRLPLVIDEPGIYAIDRNWEIPGTAAAANPELIRITAADVTLDLHGFAIVSILAAPPTFTLLVITGRGAEIRNGELGTCCDGAATVRSTTGPRLHHLSISSNDRMIFEGVGTDITDSHILARSGMQLASFSRLERNTIACVIACVRLLGDRNQVTSNKFDTFRGGGIAILGNTNIVANNVVDTSRSEDAPHAFVVEGNINVVRNNTVLISGFDDLVPLWAISGTLNTLDGNIAAPSASGPQSRARIGMEFTADGNFYGDNRMAAQVPFALGGTVQTDWGGNVGY